MVRGTDLVPNCLAHDAPHHKISRRCPCSVVSRSASSTYLTGERDSCLGQYVFVRRSSPLEADHRAPASTMFRGPASAAHRWRASRPARSAPTSGLIWKESSDRGSRTTGTVGPPAAGLDATPCDRRVEERFDSELLADRVVARYSSSVGKRVAARRYDHGTRCGFELEGRLVVAFLAGPIPTITIHREVHGQREEEE